MIPIQREPAEFVKESGGIIERCVFCLLPTRYWHVRTNNPVCESCAKNHKVTELYDWRKGKR